MIGCVQLGLCASGTHPATTAVAAAESVIQAVSNQESVSLKESLLEAVGKRLDPEKFYGSPIEEEIALRVNEIIEKGLPEEELKDLLKKYATPKNCQKIDPPLLNLPMKVCLAEGALNRDVRMVSKQAKLAAALSALTQGLSKLINISDVDLNLIREISDAVRFIADVHRDESLTRMSLVLANLNPDLREALNVSKIGKDLFDTDLEEQIKVAKTLDRTSKELRKGDKSTTSKVSKNVAGPSCLRSWKFQSRGGGQKKRSWNGRSIHTYQRSKTNTSSKRRDQSYSHRR